MIEFVPTILDIVKIGLSTTKLLRPTELVASSICLAQVCTYRLTRLRKQSFKDSPAYDDIDSSGSTYKVFDHSYRNTTNVFPRRIKRFPIRKRSSGYMHFYSDTPWQTDFPNADRPAQGVGIVESSIAEPSMWFGLNSSVKNGFQQDGHMNVAMQVPCRTRFARLILDMSGLDPRERERFDPKQLQGVLVRDRQAQEEPLEFRFLAKEGIYAVSARDIKSQDVLRIDFGLVAGDPL